MADIRNTFRGRDRTEIRAMINRMTRLIRWQAAKEAKPGRGGPIFQTGGASLTALNGVITSALIAALSSKGPIFTPMP
jgi:hypothetical protein